MRLNNFVKTIGGNIETVFLHRVLEKVSGRGLIGDFPFMVEDDKRKKSEALV
jgi:hypothetical protein